MALPLLFRVQDSQGRGPFRPGMSKRWIDNDTTSMPPSFIDEFGMSLVTTLRTLMNEKGGACGCALATRDQVCKWFTLAEQLRLEALGYYLVAIQPHVILAESPNQIVFWRKLPLRRNVTIIPWIVPCHQSPC